MTVAPLAAQARLGRYVLVERLGAGAMGEVWLADDPALGRQVAIKVLRGELAGWSERLRREARAMAQLVHPAVVAVHDVGESDGRVYIAMERITGTTVRVWMAPGRPWRAVVATFLAAGRGLAAAHAAGLVHRDVKPDNVMLAADGRVVVGDFGIARLGSDDGGGGDRPAALASSELATNAGAGGLATLTGAGDLIGTPAYMAPEQHLGRGADAASDQFAFCVSLWEGLYGERPFGGGAEVDAHSPTAPALGPATAVGLAIIDGKRRPPPARAAVPAWLRRVVERGLDGDPARRFPSMTALIGALERGLARRRRAVIGAGVAAAAAVVVAAVLWPRPAASRPPPCRDAAALMASTWGPAQHARLDAAFAATGVRYAPDVVAQLAAALDRRAAAWVALRTSACEATEVHRTQSPALLDRRMACLDDRRAELAAAIDTLAGIAPDEVATAQPVVAKLPSLDSCSDADALAKQMPLPDDPIVRAQRTELIRRLAAVSADIRLGARASAADAAAALAADFERLGDARLAAQSRQVEGYAATLQSDLPRARRALEATTRGAADAGDDVTAADAWVALALVAIREDHVDVARATLTAADAAVRRAGRAPKQRYQLLELAAGLAMSAGDLAGAREQFAAGLAVVEAELPDDVGGRIQALSNLTTVESQLGDEHALAHAQQAVELGRAFYGERHPAYGDLLAALGRTQRMAGDVPGALATLERAVAAVEAAEGPRSATLAQSLTSLGNAQAQSGDVAHAIPTLERAVAISRDGDRDGLIAALSSLANAKSKADDDAGAIAALEEVLPLAELAHGKDSLAYARPEAMLAAIRDCGGDAAATARARAALTHAVETLTRIQGADHPETRMVAGVLPQCS